MSVHFYGPGAEAIGKAGAADLSGQFIANPELPGRLREHLLLNPYDRDTYY
jgi:N-ethylmaleimide reductase